MSGFPFPNKIERQIMNAVATSDDPVVKVNPSRSARLIQKGWLQDVSTLEDKLAGRRNVAITSDGNEGIQALS